MFLIIIPKIFYHKSMYIKTRNRNFGLNLIKRENRIDFKMKIRVIWGGTND